MMFKEQLKFIQPSSQKFQLKNNIYLIENQFNMANKSSQKKNAKSSELVLNKGIEQLN